MLAEGIWRQIVTRAYILSDADVSCTSMTGPGPLLPASGGATKGRTPFVGVRESGVGMMPAFLSDATRSDPAANAAMGLVGAAANTEADRSWARDACATGGVADPRWALAIISARLFDDNRDERSVGADTGGCIGGGCGGICCEGYDGIS